MKRLYTILIFCLCLCGTTIGANEMDSNTLIAFLNLSKTLIHDGEFKLMIYDKELKRPEEIGRNQRKFIATYEQELEKTSDTQKAKRKRILNDIDELKKYGSFSDTPEHFGFFEVNMVCQNSSDVFTDQTKFSRQSLNYRIEVIDRFDKYPSLALQRFHNAPKQALSFPKTAGFELSYPPQFAKSTSNMIGIIQDTNWVYNFPPIYPVNFIDEDKAKVTQRLSSAGEPITYINHFPFSDETVRIRLYIRFVDGLPQVFQEEFHYKSSSPIADEDGYWVRIKNNYSEFEILPSLNVPFPRRMESRYYAEDGWQLEHEIISIKEMSINNGLPANFFDWNEQEFHLEDGEIGIVDLRYGEDPK